MRINKYLAECGFCSRREADRLTEQGKVTINGMCAQMGSQVEDGDVVCVDGVNVNKPEEHRYLAFNKPRGIVCTLSKKEENSLLGILDIPGHITYSGRLDKESQGLLILTDDGYLIDKLMTAKNGHEKEYVVRVNGTLNKEKIQLLEKGVYLEDLDRTTRPCKAWITGDREFHIILTEGINRQIRRMCKAVGLNVTKLERIRIENVLLGNLKPGKYRKLNESELSQLKKTAGIK